MRQRLRYGLVCTIVGPIVGTLKLYARRDDFPTISRRTYVDGYKVYIIANDGEVYKLGGYSGWHREMTETDPRADELLRVFHAFKFLNEAQMNKLSVEQRKRDKARKLSNARDELLDALKEFGINPLKMPPKALSLEMKKVCASAG